MRIIVCLDDRNGMLFNKRRQSKDSLLRKEMLALCKNDGLWMNEYSAKQFESLPEFVTVHDKFLEMARDNGSCFVENIDVLPIADKIDSLVIYRWNRCYPGDVYFPTKEIIEGKRLVSKRDFAGSSHDKITEEIYER